MGFCTTGTRTPTAGWWNKRILDHFDSEADAITIETRIAAVDSWLLRVPDSSACSCVKSKSRGRRAWVVESGGCNWMACSGSLNTCPQRSPRKDLDSQEQRELAERSEYALGGRASNKEHRENTFTMPSDTLMRLRYWRKSSTDEILNDGLMRLSINSKAGLASIFFVDEICWISASIGLISSSDSDITRGLMLCGLSRL